jgi:hypothetical protein
MGHRDGVRTRVEILGQRTGMLGDLPRPRGGCLRVLYVLASGVVSLLAAFVMLGSVTPAQADVVQCGDVLGPGGRFTLEQDIVCQGGTSVGVTVQDGAVLDLNGHTVNCSGLNGCVLLTGAGATLLNGKVQNAGLENIRLGGTGRHTVRNVTSVFVDLSVIVTSDHNTLIDVVADGGLSSRFTISGHHNRLVNSIALCGLFGEACIRVEGDRNLLIGNVVTVGPDHTGIEISGDNNVVERNRVIWIVASGTSHPAIDVTGTGNRIMHNTAMTEGATDLVDRNGDCTHNTWRRNIFVTSDPACIR